MDFNLLPEGRILFRSVLVIKNKPDGTRSTLSSCFLPHLDYYGLWYNGVTKLNPGFVQYYLSSEPVFYHYQ